MASPPFCPRGPSPKPLAPRVVNVRERGGRVQAGLQAGHAEAKAAKSCSYLCISQHPHPFAGFQRPKTLPLTGDSSLLHSAREGQEFWWLASCQTSAERHAEGHVFRALWSLACLVPYARRPDLGLLPCMGSPIPAPCRAIGNCLTAPAAAVPSHFPLFFFQDLS